MKNCKGCIYCGVALFSKQGWCRKQGYAVLIYEMACNMFSPRWYIRLWDWMSELLRKKIKVTQIELLNGDVFLCESTKDNMCRFIKNHKMEDIAKITHPEMSEEEYYANPATNSSAAAFENIAALPRIEVKNE